MIRDSGANHYDNSKKFNGMYHGIISNERRYYQGQNVDAYCDMSDVQWYNTSFCNHREIRKFIIKDSLEKE